MSIPYEHTPPDERDLPPRVRVTDAQRHHWQAALIRGQEHRLAVKHRFERTTDDGVRMVAYRVQSHSEPGHWHHVVIARDWEREVWSVCGCSAGGHGLPCQHSAMALSAEDWFPFPVARLQALPLEAVSS